MSRDILADSVCVSVFGGLDINGFPRPLQRSRARMLFSETAGRLFEPAAGGRVPDRAEKTACAREAEGQAAGRASFGTFLGGKKSTRIKEREKYFFNRTAAYKIRYR